MNKWTKEEEQFLKENYENKGPKYCAEKLGRTYHSTQQKAARLNLTKPIAQADWTGKEIQFLVDNYPGNGAHYCAKKLNRTYKSVNIKASRLNLKTNSNWFEQDTEFLIKNYADNGPAYCAKKLNKTYATTVWKASKLNLQANTKHNSNIVYAVYFPDLFLYKIGITNNVERRIKQFGQPCVILKIQECEPTEAAQLERNLLKSVTLINTGALNNGNTETFMRPSKEIEEFLGKQFA